MVNGILIGKYGTVNDMLTDYVRSMISIIRYLKNIGKMGKGIDIIK